MLTWIYLEVNKNRLDKTNKIFILKHILGLYDWPFIERFIWLIVRSLKEILNSFGVTAISLSLFSSYPNFLRLLFSFWPSIVIFNRFSRFNQHLWMRSGWSTITANRWVIERPTTTSMIPMMTTSIIFSSFFFSFFSDPKKYRSLFIECFRFVASWSRSPTLALLKPWSSHVIEGRLLIVGGSDTYRWLAWQ